MAAACPARARLSSATATVAAPLPSSSPSILMLRRRPSAPRRFPLFLVSSASSSSGKGFGGSSDNKSNSSSSSSAKKGNKKDEPSLLRQALDRASPIDPREASRGRVDVATVKSWKGLDVSSKQGKGASDASALGELELKSFVPGGKDGEAAAPASFSSSPPQPTLASQPLYEALARRLAVLQASGALAEEQPATKKDASSGSKRAAQRRKLPRYEDWRWNEKRYVQFLTDCLEVHSALESAVGEALRAAEGVFGARGGGGGEGGTAVASGGESAGGGASLSSSSSSSSPSSSSSQSRLAAFAALSYLGPSCGLSRAEEIVEDLAAIFETASSSSASGGGSTSDSSPSPPSAPPANAPKPSAEASATARYLLDLGARAARELVSEAGEEELGAGGAGAGAGGAARSPAGDENCSGRTRAERAAAAGAASSPRPPPPPPPPASASAALRLLANCYALHVTHLTTGMRVGAAASEALGLLRRRAAGFYQTYPENLSLAPRRPPLLLMPPPSSLPASASANNKDGDNKRIVDPLRAFRSAVDGAGRALSLSPAPPPPPPPPTSTSASAPLPPPPTPPPPLPSSLLLLAEVEGELVAAVRRAAALFEPLASAEP